jgi:3-hydroxyacyl-CoA dehydrogenase
MELIEINIPGDVFKKIKYENDISDRLWTNTDDLASNIKHKLENVGLDKEMIESYVAEVSKILSSNLDSRELANWRLFVESVYENIDLK